ncbi:MAG: hypothetical protein ABI778_05995, partial [Ignavibacteriota bacterium]
MKYAILIYILIATTATAQPGAVDRSFGDHDMIRTDFGGRYDYISVLAIQPDGKILAAGTSSSDQPGDAAYFALARYYPDGSLDSSFGTYGKATCDFGIKNCVFSLLMLGKDGKIILTGNFNGKNNDGQILLARFNSDGTPDGTFGTSGKVETHFTTRWQAFSFASQSDGKIVVAGVAAIDADAFSFNNVLIRFNEDGSMDNSFGNSGIAVLDRVFNKCSIAIQSDDRIVAFGNLYQKVDSIPGYGLDGWPVFSLQRFTQNGIPDVSFGDNGKVKTKYIGSNGGTPSLIILPDNRILTGAISLGIDTNRYVDSVILLQFTQDGKTDSTFGRNGVVAQQLGDGHCRLFTLNILGDGKIVEVGDAVLTNGGENFIVRRNSDGTLDKSFGSNGTFLSKTLGFNAAVFQNDKVILSVNPRYYFDFVLERVNANGTLDNTFSFYQGILATYYSGNDEATAISISSDDHILIGGYSDELSTGFLSAIRYHPDGTLDLSFGQNGRWFRSD